MDDRGSNQKFIIRGSNTTLSLPECYKRNAKQGSVSYYPTQEVFEASQNWKCLCYEVKGTNDRTLNRIPLVVNGGKFIDINVMEIGDYYYYHDSDKDTVVARVDNKTLYAVNSTGVIDDGTSFTWQEDFTNIDVDFFVFDDKIQNVGELEIEYHLYKNGVEVPYYYITNDELEVWSNGSYINYYSFYRTGYLKIKYSNNVFSIFDASQQITQINATGDNLLGLRFTEIDTDEVDEIRVSYTWKWK